MENLRDISTDSIYFRGTALSLEKDTQLPNTVYQFILEKFK